MLLSWIDKLEWVYIQIRHKGRVQKFLISKLVDFSIKWVGGVPLVN